MGQKWRWLCAVGFLYHNGSDFMLNSLPRFFSGISRSGGGGWSVGGFLLCFFQLGQLFATAGTRIAMCCVSVGKNNAKSMTEKNGGGASPVCNSL
jgi:hypothetical protein